ncbi:hypothetical protein ACFVZD_43440 [Streptomyces sp. NPDC058287]|uniref:hypothetical protein n=1 Tax=unclassified Streptomyces TaxID=2593676 RepID=UPI0036EC6083
MPIPPEDQMRIVFDPQEQDALRADARDQALTDPGVSYVLERLAAESVDLVQCADWEDAPFAAGPPPRTASSAA